MLREDEGSSPSVSIKRIVVSFPIATDVLVEEIEEVNLACACHFVNERR
jgi:hypothetical protein